MPTRFKFEGLAELKADLRNMPYELRDAAKVIIDQTADLAADDIRNAYPEVTGNLKKGVKVRPARTQPSQFGYSVVVVNIAPHALIFELGTGTRTFNGQNRGSMPPGKVFIPRMEKHRRRMDGRLKLLMESQGLTVTDDGGF